MPNQNGWRIIRLSSPEHGGTSPGKRPIDTNWPELPAPSEETVDEWLAEGFNLGVATGHGFVVVDHDHAEIPPEFPPTLTAKTGSGWHQYYSTSAKIPNSAKKLSPHIDVRGLGGQVVIPPSRHVSGVRYTWHLDVSMVPLPKWIEEALALTGKWIEIPDWSKADHRPKGYGPAALSREVARLAGTAAGSRNDQLFRSAANLSELVNGGHVGDAEAKAALIGAAMQAGLGEAEIDTTIRSAFKKTAGKARGPQAAHVRIESPPLPNHGPAPEPEAPRLEFEAFPADVFPPVLREFIERRAHADCVDPSFVSLPMLAILAGAIGNACEVELKPGWTEPSVLWIAAIGRSGSRKSVALKHVQAPLDRLQRKAREEWKKAHAAYVCEMLRYQHSQREATKKDGGGVSLMGKPTKPIQRRFIVSDTTTEALASILSEQDTGVALCRDELSGWVSAFNQYKAHGGADEAFWLAVFDARPAHIERKTGEERSIYIDRSAVSVAGGIQPGVLARVFTRERQESGLFARVLVAFPPEIAATWNETVVSADIEEGYARTLERLSRLPLDRWPEGQIKPRRMPLEPGAKHLYRAFFDSHNRESVQLDEHEAASASKLLGVCGRLALVLEMAHWASSEGATLQPDRISRWAMEGAIQLAQWFAHEALRVHALLRKTPAESDLDSIEKRIAARGGRITVREWQRSRSKRTSAAAHSELQSLVDAARAAWEKGEHGSTILVLKSMPATTQATGASSPPPPAPPEGTTAEQVSVPSVSDQPGTDSYAEAERKAIQALDGVPREPVADRRVEPRAGSRFSEERAALMEYDGGLSREEAETRARGLQRDTRLEGRNNGLVED